MVQLACGVTHGCQWFDSTKGPGSLFGGTNNPFGTNFVWKTGISTNSVYAARSPDFGLRIIGTKFRHEHGATNMHKLLLVDLVGFLKVEELCCLFFESCKTNPKR